LRVRLPAHTQRFPGQSGVDSWAAGKLARLGQAAVFALIVSSCLMPPAAGATSRGAAAEPSPQRAPAPLASARATPDPPPQAAARSHPTAPPTTSGRVPTVVRPVPTVGARTTPLTPAIRRQPSSVAPVTTSAPSHAARPAPSGRPHHASRSHAPARPAPPMRRSTPPSVSFSFPFASLPKSLLGLPRAALHADAEAHHGGVLLLLSSLAMGAFAAASFALLRRLRRLEGSAR
jgi:hypothetical protein